MSNNNVLLHRVLKASPEKVYRAFTESLAIASWLPPYGFLCTVHEMDVKEAEHTECRSRISQPAMVILLVVHT